MNRPRIWIGMGVVAAVLGALFAYLYFTDPGRLTTAPVFSGLKRTVSDNVLSSPKDPSLLMTLDKRYRHIGGQRFVLYGTADVEQHFFVEEHSDGRLKGVFWVQFEAFLPDNDFTYDYSSSPLRVQIGDFDFYTDAEPGSSGPFRSLWPGTDGYLARKFVARNGYSWPDNFSYARLVHLPDASQRTELLIIFVDDLASTGWTGPELREGGKHSERWPELEAAHLDKIKEVMKLSRPATASDQG